MRVRDMLDKAKTAVGKITLEPIIFLFSFAIGILAGVQVQTNLQLWKICHIVFGHNDTACKDLNSFPNETIKDEVQVFSNNFDIKSQWFGAVPAIVYSVFAGALSDRYGRKPLMVLPLTGVAIATALSLINFAFIRELPLEFFYFNNIFYFMGGSSLYYLGTYGYGADVTTPDERAFRLGIYDGFELLAYTIGNSLSSPINENYGNYGSYTVSLSCYILAVLYAAFVVKENNTERIKKRLEEKQESEGEGGAAQDSIGDKIHRAMTTFIVVPFKEFLQTLSKKRPDGLRTLLRVQILVYMVYWALAGYDSQLYLYMVKLFEGFQPSEFAQMNVVSSVCNMVTIFVLVPIFSGSLKWHETSCLVIITSTTAAAFFLYMLPRQVWPWMYIIEVVKGLGYAQYSQARSLFTRCIAPDEVGKVYSAVAIITAIMPFLSGFIVRKLYNATIATFPQAFMVYGGCIYSLSVVGNIFLFTKRSRMQGLTMTTTEEGGSTQKEGDNKGYDNNGLELTEKSD